MAAAGHQAEEALDAAMRRERRQVHLRRRGLHPGEGRRHLLQDRRQDRHRHADRGRREPRRGGHRHRLLRLLGRHPVGRARTHRGASGVADVLKEQARRQHPGLPAQPLQLPRHGAALRDLRQAARARRQGPPEVRLRPRHPRELPAPRALRRRPLRPARSATRGTARAGASTSSAARAPRRTTTARRCPSATSSAPGRSASAPPASAARRRASASPCRCFYDRRRSQNADPGHVLARRRRAPGESARSAAGVGRRGGRRAGRRAGWSGPEARRRTTTGRPRTGKK